MRFSVLINSEGSCAAVIAAVPREDFMKKLLLLSGMSLVFLLSGCLSIGSHI
ncbi:hypothetical protein BN1221_03349 [Brenneria goodwinii]|uniref:Uncharacterized protein n=1 Tax=Brenneria goodwinii TaxID=1109412 RepID=A0A0G4JYR7_9GAMM|nr:hypothetical protein BN1221_03349 [Brenneria goodwinii]